MRWFEHFLFFLHYSSSMKTRSGSCILGFVVGILQASDVFCVVLMYPNPRASCLFPIEFEKVPEKSPWCWFPANQSYQGCGFAGCWSKRYVTHLDLFLCSFVTLNTTEGAKCESVFVVVVFRRQERSLLRVGAGERPAADPHSLQEPQPRVENRLHIVSLSLPPFSCSH